MRLIFAPNARTDLTQLLLQSRRQWGIRQRNAYKLQIDRALGELTEYPFLGRSRDEISLGLRSYPVGSHLIYYQVQDQAVVILRIIHNRRDIRDEVGLNAP